MRKVYFEIKKSKSKKEPFYWTLRASNGQVYCHSENFTQKASIKASISNVINALQKGAFLVEDQC